MLIELKGRFDVPDFDLVTAVRTGGVTGGPPSILADVREALAGLGYGPDEVRDALRDVSAEGRDAPGLLRDALKVLGARRA